MVKIFYTDVRPHLQEEIFTKGISGVCPTRRDKILRCALQEDRARSLAAGLLLRYALEQLGLSYESAEFSEDEHGRPVLMQISDCSGQPVDLNCHPIFFNLSHSMDYAVVAVATQPIGVDIEYSVKRWESDTKLARLFSVMKKCFTENEMLQVLRTTDSAGEAFDASKLSKEEKAAICQRAMCVWTKKESYAKAKGLGLRMNFQEIDTCMEGFYSWEPLEGYVISAYLDVSSDMEKRIQISDLTEVSFRHIISQ